MNVVGIFVQPGIKSVSDFFKTSKKSLSISEVCGFGLQISCNASHAFLRIILSVCRYIFNSVTSGDNIYFEKNYMLHKNVH